MPECQVVPPWPGLELPEGQDLLPGSGLELPDGQGSLLGLGLELSEVLTEHWSRNMDPWIIHKILKGILHF